MSLSRSASTSSAFVYACSAWYQMPGNALYSSHSLPSSPQMVAITCVTPASGSLAAFIAALIVANVKGRAAHRRDQVQMPEATMGALLASCQCWAILAR